MNCKEEECYKESRNEKLEKLKVDDLRVGEKLFEKFLNDNKGDVQKFLKIKIYDKRPMHMMDPILDDIIYGLMSKYNLEQFERAKNIFNWFIQNKKDICSQLPHLPALHFSLIFEAGRFLKGFCVFWQRFNKAF